MKKLIFLALAVVSLVIACELTARPETTEPESQTSSSPTPKPSVSLTEEIIAGDKSSPVTTPTGEPLKASLVSPVVTPRIEIPQSSPVATSMPEDSVDEQARRETGRVNVPDDAAIIFHRGGGFAGVDERWIIYPDGRIEGPAGEQRQVKPEQVQALLETIQAAGFFDLDNSYVPLNTCCDRFTYAITVQVGDKTKTVRTIDASPTQPEQLTTIINAIGELLFTP
jgi:hypothetical protein